MPQPHTYTTFLKFRIQAALRRNALFFNLLCLIAFVHFFFVFLFFCFIFIFISDRDFCARIHCLSSLLEGNVMHSKYFVYSTLCILYHSIVFCLSGTSMHTTDVQVKVPFPPVLLKIILFHLFKFENLKCYLILQSSLAL